MDWIRAFIHTYIMASDIILGFYLFSFFVGIFLAFCLEFGLYSQHFCLGLFGFGSVRDFHELCYTGHR